MGDLQGGMLVHKNRNGWLSPTLWGAPACLSFWAHAVTSFNLRPPENLTVNGEHPPVNGLVPCAALQIFYTVFIILH